MDAEVARALEAADRLLPSMDPERPAPSSEPGAPGRGRATLGAPFLAAVEVLARAERGLAADAPEGPLVRARLGGLYGKRYLNGEVVDGDRDEGLRLLRAARAARGPGALDRRERLRATLILTTLVLPMPQPGPGGGTPGFERVLAWGAGKDARDPRVRAELAEAERLLREVEGARLPEPLPREVARLRSTLAMLSAILGGGDLTKLVGAAQQLFQGQLGAPSGTGRMLRGMLSLLPGVPVTGPPTPPEEPPRWTVERVPPGEAGELEEAGRREEARDSEEARELDGGGPEASATPAAPAAPSTPATPAAPSAPTASPAAPTASPATPAAGSPAEDAAERTSVALTALLAEMYTPGVIGTERFGELVEELRAAPSSDPTDAAVNLAVSGLGEVMLALRTGRPDQVDEAYERMRGAAEALPPDHPMRLVLRNMLGIVPAVAAMTRGNLADEAETLRLLSSFTPEPLGDLAALPGSAEARQLTVLNRATVIGIRLRALWGDPSEAVAVEEALTELRGLAAQVNEGSMAHGLIQWNRVIAHLMRARLRGTVEDLRTALRFVAEMRESRATPDFVHQLLETGWPVILTLSASLERDPSRILGTVESGRAAVESWEPATVHARAVARWSIGEALLTHHELTGERRSVAEAVEELRLARGELVEDTDSHATHMVLWGLARAHARRADRAAGDLRAAVEAGLDALHVVADDVLMQLGAEHGLEKARDGADQALRVAGWAMAEGDLASVVRALEVGRALVLRAAAASVAVPEQLEALGERELAEEWRRAAPPGSRAAPEGGAAAAQLLGADVGPAVPSRLRRLALDALGRGRAGRRSLLAAPGIPELADGVDASGADALVYLIPGQGSGDGAALVVGRAAAGVSALPLPGLSAAGRRPLEGYLAAAARRSAGGLAGGAPADGGPTGAHAEAAWEAALDELCAWAGPAVVGPLLERLTAGGKTGVPLRVVLVPCGNLGVVPWHAARLASGYACQVAVVSYAASGAQFLAAVGRRRMAPAERPVLVADPRLDLLWAGQEVAALHAAYYPRASLYGEFVDEPAAGVAGAGTPEELLAVLPGAPDGAPASLLHVASHGEAGARPTVSALALADSGRPSPAAHGQPSADDGLLTVSRLLDRPGGPAPDEPGPLVVLSACETDLSRRDHDEALTLTTAFVARGATDAVGSRWTTGDSAAALMMTVLHHHLTVGGLAPADALRAAQLWMLDPERRPPPGVGGELAREARHPSLGRLPAWAAFIHQGSPRPAGPDPRAGAGGGGTVGTAGAAGAAGAAGRAEGEANGRCPPRS